jgi:hypothetical protein
VRHLILGITTCQRRASLFLSASFPKTSAATIKLKQDGPNRRKCIKDHFRKRDCKPDFLALQDGGLKVDVTEIIDVLNKKWESSYSHISKRRYDHHNVEDYTAATYKRNHEALVYNANIWEYLKDDLELPRDVENHLQNRFRAGMCHHRSSKHKVLVVSFHGRKDYEIEVKAKNFISMALPLSVLTNRIL